MNLMKASDQWSKRPADERFWTWADLKAAAEQSQRESQVGQAWLHELRVEVQDSDLKLVGRSNIPAGFTHWSFGQLCARIGAPAGYLRDLPATLAAQNMNHGFKNAQREQQASLLFSRKAGPTGEVWTNKAALTPSYSRLWHSDICRKLESVLPAGFRPPPARPPNGNVPTRPATAEDVLRLQKPGLSVQVGDPIAPAGLYMSDRDLFIFMVNEDIAIDDGTGNPLGRGFFLWNSEVGSASFGIMTFLYDAVCGNHIVWGAKNVTEFRVRHVGAAEDRAFGAIQADLIEYANESASEEEAIIKRARTQLLGKTKDEAIDAVFKVLSGKLGKKEAEAAYELAEKSPRYGAPGSVWGMVNGITELSQQTTYTDERVKLDRAAGKLMDVVQF